MEIELPDGTILEAPDDADVKQVVQGYNRSKLPAASQAQQKPSALDHMLGVAKTAIPGGMALPMVDLANRYIAQFADVAGEQALDPQKGGNLRANIQSGGVIPKDYAGSPAAATAVNVGVQLLPSVLFRGGPNVSGAARAGNRLGIGQGKPLPAGANAGRAAGLGRVPEVTPSLEELSAQSKAAYKLADDSGITIAPESISGLKNRIGATLKKEGVDRTLHPSTTAAFKRIAESKGEVSLDQLETLRKIAKDASGSIDKADARLGRVILEEMDDYVSKIGSADLTAGNPKSAGLFKEARALYTRKAKAEEIGELLHRADLKAQGYSSSGLENALRAEFRALATNKNRMRMFSAEERAAIEKVAKGDNVSNALRQLGKFSPSDRIGQIMGLLATASTGFIGAALPAAGAISRYAATRMTKNSAAAAEELMRRGPRGKSHSALLEEAGLLPALNESGGLLGR